MKQIIVNEKCSGCGLCIVNCKYLQESSDGNAEPVIGKAIQDQDMENVKKVVERCPEKALSIIESGTSRKGIAGISEIIAVLKEKTENFKVQRVGRNDVKMNVKEYNIPIPVGSSKEYKRDYTSESSARSAARDEFDRLCYSESAYRPIIKKVFVEYKVNVLRPYYTCTDTEESVYYSYNQKIRKILADAYTEINYILGNNKIPKTWKEFPSCLNENDICIEQIKMFDEKSTNSGIIAALKDLPYTSLNDYVSEMDFDYDEIYVGEGMFGKPKYKNMWYFSRFNKAAEIFIKDLTNAIKYQSGEIEEYAVDIINCALEIFEKKVKEKLKNKISELEKLTK